MATIRCEKCGSIHIDVTIISDNSYSVKKGLLGRLFFGLGGEAMGIGGKKKETKSFHCKDCGWQSSKSMDDIECWHIEQAMKYEDKEKCSSYKNKYKNIEWEDETNSNTVYESSTCLTKIKEEQFSCNEEITEYIIPNTVVEIGERAFFACKNLKSVIIPSSVLKIGEMAFQGCANLTTIIFSNGLKEIGERAFCCCRNLTEVQIPTTVYKIGDDAFCETGIKKIEIPQSVKFLGKDVFRNSQLERLEIPESVVQLADTCIAFCKKIQHYKLHPSTKRINFMGCKELEAIEIPEGIEIIDGLHDKYESITLPSTVRGIGYHAFSYCEKLKELIITSEIEYFESRPFNSNTKIIFTKMKIWEDQDGTIIDLTIPENVKAMFRQNREWNRKK